MDLNIEEISVVGTAGAVDNKLNANWVLKKRKTNFHMLHDLLVVFLCFAYSNCTLKGLKEESKLHLEICSERKIKQAVAVKYVNLSLTYPLQIIF